MADDVKIARGRPENRVSNEKLTVPFDPATLKMLDSLSVYGRFGVTRQDVALFIIRLWLWENESRLNNTIQNSSKPYGIDIEKVAED